jgi:hypothetical protein
VGRFLNIAKTASGQTAVSARPTQPSPAVRRTNPSACQAPARPPAPTTTGPVGGKPERTNAVRAAYSGVIVRLARLYPSDMDSAWDVIATRPEYLRAIEIAEVVAEREALAYQEGRVSSATYQAALRSWEKAWATALAGLGPSANACQDCARSDVTLLITTTTGRYCRRCLRDEAEHD